MPNLVGHCGEHNKRDNKQHATKTTNNNPQDDQTTIIKEAWEAKLGFVKNTTSEITNNTRTQTSNNDQQDDPNHSKK